MIRFGNVPNLICALTFRQSAEKFPPAGGMGDWEFPQQARLSYKRYACANAAYGGKALCTDLSAPICQSAGRTRKFYVISIALRTVLWYIMRIYLHTHKASSF